MNKIKLWIGREEICGHIKRVAKSINGKRVAHIQLTDGSMISTKSPLKEGVRGKNCQIITC